MTYSKYIIQRKTNNNIYMFLYVVVVVVNVVIVCMGEFLIYNVNNNNTPTANP